MQAGMVDVIYMNLTAVQRMRTSSMEDMSILPGGSKYLGVFLLGVRELVLMEVMTAMIEMNKYISA
jgi:hypothetical protein